MSALRSALRLLAPRRLGARGAGLRRAALVALMPRMLREIHLLDLRTKFYFTLNETGVAVWKMLAPGEPAEPRELAAGIARQFDSPSAVAVEAVVKELLEALHAQGLLLEEPR